MLPGGFSRHRSSFPCWDVEYFYQNPTRHSPVTTPLHQFRCHRPAERYDLDPNDPLNDLDGARSAYVDVAADMRVAFLEAYSKTEVAKILNKSEKPLDGSDLFLGHHTTLGLAKVCRGGHD